MSNEKEITLEDMMVKEEASASNETTETTKVEENSTPKKADISKMKVVTDVTDIKPAREVKETKSKFETDLINDINSAILRKAEEFTERRNELRAYVDEIKEEKELNEIDGDSSEITQDTFNIEDDIDIDDDFEPVVNKNYVVRNTTSVEETTDKEEVEEVNKEEIELKKNLVFTKTFSDSDDIESEEDEIEKEVENSKEETMLKNAINKTIRPFKDAIDISSFSVRKSPMTVNMAIGAVKENVADWVLPNQKKIISMSEFKGSELEKLNPRNYSGSTINTFTQIYRKIFDHIENIKDKSDKGFNEWLKTFNFYDVDHLFFAIYIASFNGVNSIPYSCPECKHAFMHTIDNFMDMVKYDNDESKKLYTSILNGEVINVQEENTVNVERVQISDDYVFDLKSPCIYQVIFETARLNQEFTTKVADVISIINHIDAIWYIDRESNSLIPIEIEKFDNNEIKRIKTRILRISKIISKLSNDSFQLLKSIIDTYDTKMNPVTYVLPSATCPKCGKTIEESPADAESLVFMRRQLMTIANS